MSGDEDGKFTRCSRYRVNSPQTPTQPQPHHHHVPGGTVLRLIPVVGCWFWVDFNRCTGSCTRNVGNLEPGTDEMMLCAEEDREFQGRVREGRRAARVNSPNWACSPPRSHFPWPCAADDRNGELWPI